MFSMYDIGWGWWLVMSIGMVAFWGLLFYGIVWLARRESPQQDVEAPPEQGAQAPQERPEEILERRLAAGEISIEEYERLRGAFKRKPRRPAAV